TSAHSPCTRASASGRRGTSLPFTVGGSAVHATERPDAPPEAAVKVLMLSWEFPPHNVGGLGKHVTELLPALARAGVEIQLLTPRWAGGEGEEVVSNATIVH